VIELYTSNDDLDFSIWLWSRLWLKCYIFSLSERIRREVLFILKFSVVSRVRDVMFSKLIYDENLTGF